MGDSTCSIDKCERPTASRGWCTYHYQRWSRTGDPVTPSRVMPAAGLTCSVDGCAKPVKSRGLCGAHHERKRQTGSPTTPMAARPEPKHADALLVRPPWPLWAEECIEWTGARDANGYGTYSGSDVHRLVHRSVFIALAGWEPEVVRHECDNPSCYRFEHLLGGTHADNLADRKERGSTKAMREARERRRKWRKEHIYVIVSPQR